jgi:hypothetical protein
MRGIRRIVFGLRSARVGIRYVHSTWIPYPFLRIPCPFRPLKSTLHDPSLTHRHQDNKPGGRVYIWPGSLFHHLKYMKRPRFEHYEFQYHDPGNIFAFLGNGLTITEESFGPKDLPVPYIRNHEDEVWDIE